MTTTTARAETDPVPRRRDRVGLVLALVVAAGAVARFATLDAQSMWLDEAFTALVVDRGPTDMLRWVRVTESTPPLYYSLAWLWTAPFGVSDLALRALSAVLGTLVIPVMYLIGRDLLSPRAGLAAALLAAVSPTLVWYSQEARAYSLLVLLSAVSFLFLVRARRDPSRRNVAGWAAASALALATHYFAVYLVVPALVLLVAAHPRARLVRAGALAVVAAGVLLAPLALEHARGGRTAWIAGIDLELRVHTAFLRLLAPAFPATWAGATGVASHDPPYWPVGILLLLAGAAALYARGSRPERRAGTPALVLGGAAVVLPLLLAAVSQLALGGRYDTFLDRNLLAAWVPLNAALAVVLAAPLFARVGAFVVGALAVASTVVLVLVATDESFQRDDWRTFVDSVDLSADAVAVVPGPESFALRRYAIDLRSVEGSVRARRLSVVVRGSRRDPEVVVPAAFARVGEERVQNLRVLHFESVRPTPVRAGELSSRFGRPYDLLQAPGAAVP